MNAQKVKRATEPFNSRTFVGQSDPPPPPPLLSRLSGSLEKSELPASRLREFSLVEFDKSARWKSIRSGDTPIYSLLGSPSK